MSKSTPFDLERDYLYIAYHLPNPIFQFNVPGDKLRHASKVVFHDFALARASAIPQLESFRICLGLWAHCSNAREVILIDPATSELKLSTKLEDLTKIDEEFTWQQGRSLRVCLADGKSFLRQWTSQRQRRKK